MNHEVSWQINTLNAGTSWSAELIFGMSASVTLNTVLNYSASISNASCSYLNAGTTYSQVVVGSWDPNDKSVSPAGMNGHILPSTPHTYTIRFQNTGTYEAFNVRVVDTISTYLDLSSLKILAASHPYQVIIEGRTVTFNFENIHLPDSNSNEPESHGYIQFSLMPANSFVQNSVVTNFADIYFDFNPPVRTNTTSLTADNFVGIERLEEGAEFSIFPNPVTTELNIVADSKLVGNPFTITDASGKIISSGKLAQPKSSIDLDEVAPGIYIVKIGNSARRVVKM